MRTSSHANRLPFEAEDVLRALADRVRTVRKSRGLTQADLAAKAGISTNTLVTMEKGGQASSWATGSRFCGRLTSWVA